MSAASLDAARAQRQATRDSNRRAFMAELLDVALVFAEQVERLLKSDRSPSAAEAEALHSLADSLHDMASDLEACSLVALAITGRAPPEQAQGVAQ